ncbi:MAG: energy-coupling factor transporter ATPase [Acidaminococcus fermentans]|uniref:energy-coupling factor transporter ATPase n=1 Tax=Acidaminococcus fermentans TaxID=905 RepID=UPI002431E0E4|nr:energy-coupling factor transporter ATPase [Acidaminococcus fermentans]MDD7195506.1 energy-coupling factor transporter ATPase [Acidaminococcus fermentans]MDY2852003.1 energy-coupling factor transporter ATPase [Acidaminococcus fermentans]
MSIQVDHISYTYMTHTSLEKKALDDVSFTLEKGEFVALIGHTGSGKSTLAEHLNGLLHPMAGKVLVDGVDLAAKTPEAKTARNRVGMVFQYPEHQLFAETIYEDIAFGPRNQGKSEPEVEGAVRSAMEFVDLDFDTFAQRSPFQLSGGQMRRVAIAGVVAMEPDYLIMDEPSAGLDPISRDSIFGQLRKIFEKRKMGVLLITHSMEEAAQYASRLLVMSDSRLQLDGPARELFTHEREKLEFLSVDVPESVKLAEELRNQGLPIEGTPLTKEELIRAIDKAKGWKTC